MKKVFERMQELKGNQSVRAFAMSVNVPQQTMDRYLKGREPSLDVIEQLCLVYSCSADWLLGLTDTQQQKKSSVSVVNGGGSSIAIGNGATAGRDCMECPLLQAHLKRFSKPSK